MCSRPILGQIPEEADQQSTSCSGKCEKSLCLVQKKKKRRRIALVVVVVVRELATSRRLMILVHGFIDSGLRSRVVIMM